MHGRNNVKGEILPGNLCQIGHCFTSNIKGSLFVAREWLFSVRQAAGVALNLAAAFNTSSSLHLRCQEGAGQPRSRPASASGYFTFHTLVFQVFEEECTSFKKNQAFIGWALSGSLYITCGSLTVIQEERRRPGYKVTFTSTRNLFGAMK